MYPIYVYNNDLIRTVEISPRAKKDLRKVPLFIAAKLDTWIDAVERDGLENIRTIPGYHDEPLHGQRRGQRSIRLNRSYRAIYIVLGDSTKLVRIEEVTKHEY